MAKRTKRLKPTGHSALIESMIQPAIVIGSTLMSAIAAYVLALDELAHILDHHGTPSDWFIVVLCAGMGFLIDMAIIVSATRCKMHAVRNDPRERHWLRLAKWVLVIGLSSETMTLFYFFVHLGAQAFPVPLIQVADWIHSVLAVSRSFLPPVVIAYFAAGVLPVMFDRADRNREIKSRTSANIMLLIDRLSEVFDTDDKAELLRALGGQLMLDTYATYDETARTTEDGQLRRDAKLLTHLARIHRLDWSAIAADVAPELTNGDNGSPPMSSPVLALQAPTTTQNTQPYERLSVDRTNAPAPLEPEPEDEGEEPPENDPNPPGGKRRARPESNGHDVDRSNVRKVSSNSRQAAATVERSNARSQKPPQKPQRSDTGMSLEDKDELRNRRLAAAKAILKTDPNISVDVLARRIAMATQHHISKNTAHGLMTELQGRKPKSKTSEAARNAAASAQQANN
jgi:hypothetical protein